MYRILVLCMGFSSYVWDFSLIERIITAIVYPCTLCGGVSLKTAPERRVFFEEGWKDKVGEGDQ